MKYIKQTTLIFGLLLSSCSQTAEKNANLIEGKVDIQKIGNANTIDENERLPDDIVSSINNVIDLFKQNDVEKISNIILFPLYRQYPIPSIKDKNEFIRRYNDIFDKVLIERIASSKVEQWTEMGWRGVMLDDGVVWMANSDGIITSVNYQSDFEKKLRLDLISKEKENLHISLKVFESPTYKIKTKKHLIRIDDLGNDNYRYASWKANEKEFSKPDLIMLNGEWEFEGSGGNHVITFVNENYKYKVYRNIISEENNHEVSLEVEKDGATILTEYGDLLELE